MLSAVLSVSAFQCAITDHDPLPIQLRHPCYWPEDCETGVGDLEVDMEKYPNRALVPLDQCIVAHNIPVPLSFQSRRNELRLDRVTSR